MDVTIERTEKGHGSAEGAAPAPAAAVRQAFDYTDVDAVAARIGIPLIDWARCSLLIASRMLEKGAVPHGKIVHGHYDGKVAEGTRFDGQSRIPHRWIVTPEGKIVDPVRWIFTGESTPFIHVGKGTDPAYLSSDQVVSTNKLAPALPPPYSTVGAHYSTADNPALSAWISSKLQMGPSGRISLNQIHWLATRPLDRLGEMAEPFYLWLSEQRLLGCVPEKNRQLVLEPTRTTRERRRSIKA